MKTFVVNTGKQLIYNSKLYTVQHANSAEDVYLLKREEDSIVIQLNLAELISILNDESNIQANGDNNIDSKNFMPRDVNSLMEKDKASIQRKLNYIRAVINAKNSDQRSVNLIIQDTINKVADDIEDSKPPSIATVYRWIRDYSKSNEQAISLEPNNFRKGNRVGRLSDVVIDIIEKSIIKMRNPLPLHL